MQLRHTTLVIISGLLWLAVGMFLLPLGLNLLISAANSAETFPLLQLLSPTMGGASETALFLVAIALFIGYFKGKYVLGKSAKRVVNRILSFPNPTSIANIFSLPYCLLIGAMICLGMMIKFFGVPSDIRGVVDVAVGSALINGAMIYFRLALGMQKTPTLKTEI